MPKAFISLPPHIELREILDYEPDTGRLTWKERPRSCFRHTKRWAHWNERFSDQEAGSVNRKGYRFVQIGPMQRPAARVIWKWMTGEQPPEEIDHINGNPSDNRWCNLRLATSQQNSFNRLRSNKTGLKGVGLLPSGRWVAAITANGKRRYLGVFPAPEAAHAAYCEAARRLHGTFAREG